MYTAANYSRQCESENRLNVATRHCRIGKVTPIAQSARPGLLAPFFHVMRDAPILYSQPETILPWATHAEPGDITYLDN